VLVVRVNVCNTPFVAQNTHRLAQSLHMQFPRQHGEGFARAGGQDGVCARLSSRAERNRNH